jgi:hypothetical protein
VKRIIEVALIGFAGLMVGAVAAQVVIVDGLPWAGLVAGLIAGWLLTRPRFQRSPRQP